MSRTDSGMASVARRWHELGAVALAGALVLLLGSCREANHAEAPGGTARGDIVHIGTISGEVQEFGTIASVVADSLGRVYVADQMLGKIVVFDSMGVKVAQYGGKGNGPGEFQFLTSIGLAGDDLVAEDWRLRRLTIWSKSGDVTTQEWPTDTLGYPATPEGLTSTGAGVYLIGQVARAPLRLYYSTPPVWSTQPRPEIRYARFNAEGPPEVLHAIADTAVDATGPTCASPGHITGLSAFFPTGPLRAFLPNHLLAMASTKQFRIDVLDTDSGDTIRTITEDYPSVPVTDQMWEQATQAFRDVEARKGAFTNCRLEDLRPSVRPPISALFSDDSGRLWAEIPSAQGSDAVVFKSDSLIARFSFPERDFNVAPFVSRGRLYVVSKDSLGVQSVEIYSVHLGPVP